MKLVAPDGGCVQVDAPSGRRYNGRIVDVESPRDLRALRAEGFFPASLGGVARSRSHQCPTCGRYNFIKTCGRCESKGGE